MKKGLTYVNSAFLTAIAEQLKCTTNVQKGFVQIQHPNTPGRAVYIGNGKAVARYDLSGFTHELGVDHPKPPSKRVVQTIDARADEKTILRTFFRILKEGLVDGVGDTMETARAKRTKDAPTDEQIAAAVQVAMAEG